MSVHTVVCMGLKGEMGVQLLCIISCLVTHHLTNSFTINAEEEFVCQATTHCIIIGLILLAFTLCCIAQFCVV